MDTLTALAALAFLIAIGFYFGDEQEEEPGIHIIEQASLDSLPVIDATHDFSIHWWREIYQSQMLYAQRYYVKTLDLALGYRHVLVPYPAGYVKAFRTRDGEWEWSLETSEIITAGIKNHKDIAVVGGEDGLVVAFDRLSGVKKWETRIASSVMSIGSGENAIYVYAQNGRVYSIKDDSGDILWVYVGSEPSATVYGAADPYEQEDTVYVGTGRGTLVALDKLQGIVKWEKVVGRPRGFSDLDSIVDLDAGLAIDEKRIYAGTYGGQLIAVDRLNQRNIWEKELSVVSPLHLDTIDTDQSLNNRVLLVLSEKGEIYAYDVERGFLFWKNEHLRYRRPSRPLLFSDHWIVIDETGNVFAIDRKDGELGGHYQGESGLAVNPVADKNYFYWLDQKGQLFSMGLNRKP